MDSSSFYDGLGRLIETKRPSPTVGQYIASDQKTYNARGLVEKAFLPVFVSTNLNTLDSIPPDTQPKVTISYDAMGRKNKTVNPDGTRADASFGIWQLTAFDENGHKLVSNYDAYGRLTTKQEYTGSDGRHTAYPAAAFNLYATTTYQYDAKGNLKSVTDAKGNVTTITYDALGRKTGMTDPDMHGWSYAYDANGNLICQTDAKSKALRFTYDALNRVTIKDDRVAGQQVGPTTDYVTYQYDMGTYSNSVGRLNITMFSGPPGNPLTAASYDQLGRATSLQYRVNGVYYYAGNTFDALNRLTKQNYPDGSTVVGYVYDAAGQPTGVNKLNSDGTINTRYVQNVTYNANGQMLTVLFGNNVTTTYTYDASNYRLKGLVTANASSVKLQDLSYTYDGVGNILTITDKVNTGTQTFKYDELNRLTNATGAYGTKTYAYDQIGNITQKDGWTYTYGQGGAGSHAVTSTSDGTSYAYDANGNMTQKTTGQGVWTYVYDTENRLVSVGYAPGVKVAKTIATYVYDGDGARIQKTAYRYSDPDYNNNDTHSLLVTQVGEPVITAPATYITNNTLYVSKQYEIEDGRYTKGFYLGGTKVASLTGSEVVYYHSDHLGSVNVISDSTGALRSLTEYDPFGKVSRFERLGATKIQTGWEGFNGKRLDDETGLLYYGARYYDPKLGRFITADTIVQASENPQTLNRYTYCNNSPVSLTDPDGHAWFLIPFIVAAIKGAMIGAAVGAAVSAVTGGNILQGAITGAIGGAIFGMAGTAIENLKILSLGVKSLIHGLAGAASGALGAVATGSSDAWQSALIGGLSAGVAKFAGGKLPFWGANSGSDLVRFAAEGVRQAIIGAAIGGITSVATGGEFGYGARVGGISAGVGFLANDSIHKGGYLNKFFKVDIDGFFNALENALKEGIGRGKFFGTGVGQEALDYYAERWAQTNNPMWAVPGGFAALWTPDTYKATIGVLIIAYGVRNAGMVWRLQDGSPARTVIDYGDIFRFEKHFIGRGEERAIKWHVDALWGRMRHWPWNK